MQRIGGILLGSGLDSSEVGTAGVTNQSTTTGRGGGTGGVAHQILRGELSSARVHSALPPTKDIPPEPLPDRPAGMYPMNLTRTSSPVRQRPQAVMYPPQPQPPPMPVPLVHEVPVPVPVMVPAENQLASLAAQNDAKNDHLHGRLEMVEAQMELVNSSRGSDEAIAVLHSRLKQAEVALHAQELEGLMKDLGAKQVRIDELEMMLMEARKGGKDSHTVMELRAKLTEERRAHDELRAKHKEMLASALDDINGANDKLAKQDALIDDLKARIAALERERDMLSGRPIPRDNSDELYELQEELRRLRKRLSEEATIDETPRYQAKIEQMAEIIKNLEAEMARLRAENAAKDEEIRKLRSDLRGEDDLKLELERLRERMKLEMERAVRAAEVRGEDKLHALEAELRKVRAELERSEQQLEEAQQALKKAREEDARKTRQFEDELRKAERRASDLEDEALKLRRTAERLRDIEQLANEAQAKLRDAEKALRTAQHRLEDVEHELQKERETSARLKQEVERLTKRVAELEAQRPETESLRAEVARLRELLKEQQATTTHHHHQQHHHTHNPAPQPQQQQQPHPATTIVNSPSQMMLPGQQQQPMMAPVVHPVVHPVLIPGDEDEIMRMGVELRRAMRGREEALAELESLQRQLVRAKRQFEVSQQELVTSEGKVVSLRRATEELREELDATVAQLNRARIMAQDAIEEAEATARLLNDARKIAEESRDRMHMETLRYQKEMEIQEATARDALRAQEHARKLLEVKCADSDEKVRTLSEGMNALQFEQAESARHIDQLNILLQTERETASQHLRDSVTQMKDTHKQQCMQFESTHAAAQAQTNEVAHEIKSQRDCVERELSDLQRVMANEKARHAELERGLEERVSMSADKVLLLGTEVQDLKEALADVTSQKGVVDRDLKSTQLALAKYQDYVQDKEKESDELRSKADTEQGKSHLTISRLNQDITCMTAELDAHKLAERGQAEALAEIHHCYEDASMEANRLKVTLESTSTECEESKRALKELQASSGQWFQELQEATKAHGEISARQLVIEEENRGLKREMESLIDKYEEKVRSLETAVKAADSAVMQVAEFRRQVQEQAVGLESSSTHCAQLSSESQCLQAENATLKKRMTELSLETEQLRVTSRADRNQIGLVKQLEERLTSDLDASNRRLTDALSQEATLRKDARVLQDNVDRLQLALAGEEQRFATEVASKQQILEESEARIASLEEMLRRVRVEKEQLRSDVDRLTILQDTGARAEKKLAMEVESYQSIIREQETAGAALNDAMLRQKQDAETLRSELGLAAQRDEASTRRVTELQRLNEARERSLAEEVEMERHTREDIEAQLTKARSQLRLAKKEASMAGEQADEQHLAMLDEAEAASRRLRIELEQVKQSRDAVLSTMGAMQTTMFQQIYEQEQALRSAELTSETHALNALTAAHLSDDYRLKLNHVNLELQASLRREGEASSVLEETSFVKQAAQADAATLQTRLDSISQELSATRGESHQDVQKLCKELDRVAIEASEAKAAASVLATERDSAAAEALRLREDLAALNSVRAADMDALKKDIMHLQGEHIRSTGELSAERAAANAARGELERRTAEFASLREQAEVQINSQSAQSDSTVTSLKEEVYNLTHSIEEMTRRGEHLWGLVEAMVGDSPCEGIGQVVWRIRAEGEHSPHAHILHPCEALTRIATIAQTSRSLKADFDFICATRETLTLELGSCKRTASDTYREATQLMEAVLKESNTGNSHVKWGREGLSRLCAGLGGLRSQLQWIVANCLSGVEREAAGISGDGADNTIEELRRTAVAQQQQQLSPGRHLAPVSTPRSARMKPAILVSPTPSKTDYNDLASCIGSDDGRCGSEPLGARSAQRTFTPPVSAKKGVRFVSPPDMNGSQIAPSPQRLL